MAVLLLVSLPVSLVLLSVDVAARLLLGGGAALAALSALGQTEREALATLLLQVHIQGVYAIEIFWGLWLIPFGALVARSRFLPKILGIFLVVAGIAYTAHSLVALLVPGPRPAVYEVATMIARGLGELPIILWLLIRGVRPARSAPASA